jgi:hypothetical protein
MFGGRAARWLTAGRCLGSGVKRGDQDRSDGKLSWNVFVVSEKFISSIRASFVSQSDVGLVNIDSGHVPMLQYDANLASTTERIVDDPFGCIR